MKNAIRAILALGFVFSGNAFSAGPNWTSGTMTNITSAPEGLLIMTNGGLPGNCTGTPYGWLLIKEVNKTMVATTLAMWVSGNKEVGVYTSGIEGGSYCVVSQVDPN